MIKFKTNLKKSIKNKILSGFNVIIIIILLAWPNLHEYIPRSYSYILMPPHTTTTNDNTTNRPADNRNRAAPSVTTHYHKNVVWCDGLPTCVCGKNAMCIGCPTDSGLYI